MSVSALSMMVLSLSIAPATGRMPPASAAGAFDPCGAPPAHGAAAFAVLERAAARDTMETVTICVVSDTGTLRLAGYHGELTMSPDSRVLLVDRPPGATRIENTGVPGRVSFAGVSAMGLASGPVLVLHLSRRAAQNDPQLRLTMIDVTDVAGRDVASQVHVDATPRPAAAVRPPAP